MSMLVTLFKTKTGLRILGIELCIKSLFHNLDSSIPRQVPKNVFDSFFPVFLLFTISHCRNSQKVNNIIPMN